MFVCICRCICLYIRLADTLDELRVVTSLQEVFPHVALHVCVRVQMYLYSRLADTLAELRVVTSLAIVDLCSRLQGTCRMHAPYGSAALLCRCILIRLT
jgi:hypothetical protein